MKQKTVLFCGVRSTGNTLTEAKESAMQTIERAMDGTYQPIVIHGKAFYAIIYRHPLYGWEYSTESIGKDHTRSYCVSGFAARDEAERAARLHIAQNDWNHESDDNFTYVVSNERDIQFMLEWSAWQRSYKSLRDAGFSDTEAHSMATSKR